MPSPEDIRQAVLYLTEAIGEVDKVASAEGQVYADQIGIPTRLAARRKMTMKDAKPKAKRAADLLRKAWNLLDPSIT